MRMNSETPRWAPPEVFVFKCDDVNKDILEVTVWMHSCVKKHSVAFGFILIPLADIRGLGFKKESYLIKSFESGQQQNTAVVMGIEVLDHEEATGLKEDRVFEYEAYDFFKGGWSAKNLKSDEPRFVLDHNYGDLPKIFPPGKIKITEDNISKVRQVHFSSSYYKVGDVMGVPDVEFQNRSYSLANEVFRKDSRAVLNAGIDSKRPAREIS